MTTWLHHSLPSLPLALLLVPFSATARKKSAAEVLVAEEEEGKQAKKKKKVTKTKRLAEMREEGRWAVFEAGPCCRLQGGEARGEEDRGACAAAACREGRQACLCLYRARTGEERSHAHTQLGATAQTARVIAYGSSVP